MVNLSGFGLSVAINSGIALVVLSVFMIARRYANNHFIYQPRLLHEVNRQGRPPPPPLDDSFFGWIRTVYRTPNNQVLATCGLDAYMYLRVLEYFVVMFAGMTILGIGILVPVNFSAAGGSIDNNGVRTPLEGFDTISMSNIPEKSDRLAAHILVSYCFAAWQYFLLWRLWREYHELRLAFIAQEQLQNRHLTLYVSNIPTAVKNDIVFKNTFQSFYPNTGVHTNSIAGAGGPIHSAYLAKDIDDMDEWVEDRDSALQKLEHALVEYQKDTEKRPMTATKFLCCEKKDAIEHWTGEMDRLSSQIQSKKKESLPVYHNGFVTFDSVLAYQTSAMVEKTSEPFAWKCRPAMELRDVYWPSLAYNQFKRFYMGLAMAVALYLLVFFWTIPVAFVSAISNLEKLRDDVSWLSWLSVIPGGALAVIDGFLPGLILTVFNIVLPMILYKMSKLEGKPAYSWLQKSVVDKFFIFQVVNNFLALTGATAFFAKPQDLIDNASSIVSILGQTIPTAATFFITYMLFNGLSTYPMMLLNPGGLIVKNLKKRFLTKTPRDLVDIEMAPEKDYGTSYPIALFTFILAICYSLLAPIILPFAVCYFIIAWFVNRYHFLYVYNTNFESGGRFWPVVFRKIVVCIVVGQAVFTGVLGLKKAAGVTIVSAPLFIAPVVFLYYIERAYRLKSEVLPLDAAVEIDRAREQRRRLMEGKAASDRNLTKKFLDENNRVQSVHYDDVLLRCMTRHDILFPHGTVTPYVSERAHQATLASTRPVSPDTVDRETRAAMSAVINGESKSEVQAKDVQHVATAPPIADTKHADINPRPMSSSRSMNETTVPIECVDGTGAVTGKIKETKQHAIDMAATNTADSRHNGEDGALGGYRNTSYHSHLYEAISASERHITFITPPQDYIQPSLLTPDTLPVPRHVRMIEGQRESIATDSTIYAEVWQEGMLANADATPHRHLASTGALLKPASSGSTIVSRDQSHNDSPIEAASNRVEPR